MTPTRPMVLVVVGLISLVMGLAIADLYDTATGRPIPVPLSSAVTIAAVASVLVVWTEVFRRRMRSPDQRIDPFVAVRSAALAMAASRAGAIICGLFVGVGSWYLFDLSSTAARQRALICALGAFASLATTLAGLWLERICRLPDDDDDDPPSGPGRDVGGDWVHPRAGLKQHDRRVADRTGASG